MDARTLCALLAEWVEYADLAEIPLPENFHQHDDDEASTRVAMGTALRQLSRGEPLPFHYGGPGLQEINRAATGPDTDGYRDALLHYAPVCEQCGDNIATRTMKTKHGPATVCDDPECITEHQCDRCGGAGDPLDARMEGNTVVGTNCQWCGLGMSSHPVVVTTDLVDLPYAEVLRDLNATRESPGVIKYVIQFHDGVYNRGQGFEANYLSEATRYDTMEQAEKALEDICGTIDGKVVELDARCTPRKT